jgi:hypothetical protein
MQALPLDLDRPFRHDRRMGPEGLEAIGDAVTAGLGARVLEPGAGEPHRGEQEGACLNCGTLLTGPYCHACGQSAHVHRTLGAFWHDLAHGVLHFEGKIWRTVPLLALQPGDLTRRYVEGQRARFVSPMALFLFSVFVMFAVFNAVGGPVGGSDVQADAKNANALQRQEQKLGKDIKRFEAQKAALPPGSAAASRLDSEIRDTRRALSAVRLIERKPAEDSADSIVKLDSGDKLGAFDHAYRKAKENPSLLLYKLQSNAYKFSWLLIPMSAPFVALLFLHRRRYRQYRAYDHVVFVTYSLCFMTLLVVVLSLLHAIGLKSGFSVVALLFVPPIHMYRQLKGAYALSRFSALWRTVLMVTFATLVMAIFMLMLVLLGVMH